MPTRDETIIEISRLQDELERLGVKRERVNFRRLGDEELEEVAGSIIEQLETRKRFLGVE